MCERALALDELNCHFHAINCLPGCLFLVFDVRRSSASLGVELHRRRAVRFGHVVIPTLAVKAFVHFHARVPVIVLIEGIVHCKLHLLGRRLVGLSTQCVYERVPLTRLLRLLRRPHQRRPCRYSVAWCAEKGHDATKV